MDVHKLLYTSKEENRNEILQSNKRTRNTQRLTI